MRPRALGVLRATALTALLGGQLTVMLAASVAQCQAPPPAQQNPSPMAEETRKHERLVQKELGGTLRSFSGPADKSVELRVPARVRETFDLVIHFHGASWLALQAVAAADDRAVAAVLNLGAGSGAYSRPLSEAGAFDSLLAAVTREVTAVLGKPARPGRVTLTGFSAGYGAIRSILRDPKAFAAVGAVLLLDGIHTSYVPEGSPVANGGVLDSANLATFAEFARAAIRGEKRFVITHSEIFPGTFASTTESTNWLIHQLGMRRTPVLRWGPRGMQQLSESHAGNFAILGFAGNSAPDHIDQLHAMPELLKRLRR
jgi:hypothetical protein